jgi:hypothetical protein
MEKEFIPYEQAVALKELGFDEFCLKSYGDDGLLNQNDHSLYLSAPLYQQVFRWFRKKYGLEGYVNLSDSKEGDYFYYFNYISTNNISNRRKHCDFFIGNFKSYEEAELECLKKLIKIVKKK